MNKPKMTLGQALLIDWKRELKIGDPKRILKLLYPTTVSYIFAHFVAVPILKLYYGARRYLITGYRYARHYYFLGLHNLKVWTGLYTDERLHKR